MLVNELINPGKLKARDIISLQDEQLQNSLEVDYVEMSLPRAHFMFFERDDQLPGSWSIIPIMS